MGEELSIFVPKTGFELAKEIVTRIKSFFQGELCTREITFVPEKQGLD